MVAQFAGKKYKSSSTDKLDEFLAAVGIPEDLREKAKGASAEMELVIKGDEWTVNTNTTVKNMTITFKVGKEFEHTMLTGRKVMVLFTVEGNKLIEVRKGMKESKIVREFSDSGVVMTLAVDGIVSTINFKAM